MKNFIPVLIVFCVTLGLFITAISLSPAYRPASVLFVIFSGLAALVIYSTRHSDPLLRRLFLWTLGFVILGFLINLMTKLPIFAVLGIAAPFLVIAWFNYLRYPVYFWPALHLYRQKRFSEAFQRINAWIGEHPRDWKAICLRSDLHLNHAQYAEAERDANLVIKLKPTCHEAYNQLGRSLFVQARYNEALAAYQTGCQLKPNNGYLFNIALANYRLGNFSQAFDLLKTLARKDLSLNIHNLLKLYFLGRSLEALGQPAQAQAAFDKLPRYAFHLKRYIEEAASFSDFPENLAMRADLADIERRLNTFRQSPLW